MSAGKIVGEPFGLVFYLLFFNVDYVNWSLMWIN